MKYTYNIHGMSCKGCSTSVKKALSIVDGVSNVAINLEKGEVCLAMKNSMDTQTLQKALPLKYTISNTVANKNIVTAMKQEKSKLQQLKPLLLILCYILVATIVIHKDAWSGSKMMLDFMGLFYIVFSFFKFLDVKGFALSFSMYDPLAKKLAVYGLAYPFIETALGLMFLLRYQIPVALILTIVVLGITTVGVTKTLLNKKKIQCACLGIALQLPMTEATFIENTIMIVMAVVLLIGI